MLCCLACKNIPHVVLCSLLQFGLVVQEDLGGASFILLYTAVFTSVLSSKGLAIEPQPAGASDGHTTNKPYCRHLPTSLRKWSGSNTASAGV